MAANQAVIKLNQIIHYVCTNPTLFVSLSDIEHVNTFETMNVLGLHRRQMKWPAWGGGQSSMEKKKGTQKHRNRLLIQ